MSAPAHPPYKTAHFYPKSPIHFEPIDLLAAAHITQPSKTLFSYISPLYSVDENTWLTHLLPLAKPKELTGLNVEASHEGNLEENLEASNERDAIATKTRQLVEHVRHNEDAVKMVDALLLEYSLDTTEGILLMSLAEALIRVPDSATADALIRDKMGVADWKKHLKDDNGFIVNASTWGLMMTGKVVSIDKKTTASGFLDRLTKKMGEPVIRSAMQRAMKIMGHQFVLGESIEEAKHNSAPYRKKGYTYSFDMLGEAAVTDKDAEKYFQDYLKAIKNTAHIKANAGMPKPSVSIKLSALHPRYEATQQKQVLGKLRQRCLLLIEAAREVDVDISIDAEEADRLEISLKLFESLYRDNLTQGWDGLGIVVQGYSKRAIAVLAWLASLAREVGDRIPVRLVKGAYWDFEIKLAQQKGFRGYPVWTRKEGTDVAYLACARFLLSEHVDGLIWPQFATHNAHTLASVMIMSQQADSHQNFEFQRLHGMGDALYDHILQSHQIPVRIYAPVGAHKDLLPYLVRRLLENGANSSFVHQLLDKSYPIDKLTVHPYDTLTAHDNLANPRIPNPLDIYHGRLAGFGANIFVESQWQPFKQAIDAQIADIDANLLRVQSHVCATFSDEAHPKNITTVTAPFDRNRVIGQVTFATAKIANQAIQDATAGLEAWQNTPVSKRAEMLRRIADLYEDNYARFMALCHLEAGKTTQDSIDEVREAVDFCRYYADEAQRLAKQTHEFVDLTGKAVTQKRGGRGVMVCISPWNFPLAIFTGQIVASLVAGNTVVAKPAEQTSLIAHFAIELMYEAGVPKSALQLVLGAGEVGATLTSNAAIAGVIFTGSTQTAQHINKSLHQTTLEPTDDSHQDSDQTENNQTESNQTNHNQTNRQPLPIFVAETGGQNAMIVDSTALPEQVVKDAVLSAFGSAGQRCSACRILCVQDDVADTVIELLKGAMAELVVGNPIKVATDVGPVIDKEAEQSLKAHITAMRAHPNARILAQTPINAEFADKLSHSTFVLPTAIEVDAIETIGGEHFGPILHVLRYRASELDALIDAINATGYGLTLGIHSRIEQRAFEIERRINVGNAYINRNQIGAVVGEQPFGGMGLSGTGPKAGGPAYVANLMPFQGV